MNKQPSTFASCKTFAEEIAKDNELFIFRSFKTLNARSLLCLQSELIRLEKELNDFDREDEEEAPLNVDVLYSTKCWETLIDRASLQHPRESDRVEVIQKIQDTLSKYNQALLQQKDLMLLKSPESRPYEALEGWFNEAKPFIRSSSGLMSTREDFVSLKPLLDRDNLTRSIKISRSRSAAGTTQYFSDDTVQKSATFIGIAGAAILLEVAIVIFVDNDHIGFAMVALFTLLFAVAIGLCSNARRAEMFGACAVYAAVLVVFLAGNLSSKSGA